MQCRAIGFAKAIRFLTSLVSLGMLVLLTAPLPAQFRDVTPGLAKETKETELSPEPMEQLEPTPQPEEVADEPEVEALEVPEVIEDEGPSEAQLAAEREAQIKAEMDAALIDDGQIRQIPFRGITVGKSTESDVIEAWGEPFRDAEDESKTLKYRLKPFRQVDVRIRGQKVTSILIHLDGLLSPEHVERELRMTRVQPVRIRDKYGRTMGLAYPERGVLLGMESHDPDAMVTKIQLEPISAEPFALRAINENKYVYEQQLGDLEHAIDLNPDYAWAYWLRAQIFADVGRYHDALGTSAKATHYDDEKTQYRLTRIRLMMENGNRDMALREVKHMLANEELPRIVEAGAKLTLANLIAMGPSGDYKKAMAKALEAIDVASALSNKMEYKTRRRAKHTLIDAHLLVARCISLGDFQKQKDVVPKWLSRARGLIDNYVEDEAGDRSLYLDLYRQILATAADIRNPEDPGQIVRDLKREAKRQLAKSDSPLFQARIQWKLGAALAEAVRLERQRSRDDVAVDLARDALEMLQASAKKRQSTPEQTYLIGRLYFHVGSLHAVQRKNHEEAIRWYEKAEPLLSDERPVTMLADPGTHGQMFVSMGVSYWDVGDKQKAIDITEFGTDFLQRSVVEGFLDTDVLSIPYGNLATMHKKSGNEQEAQAFAELSASIENETLMR